MWSFATRLPKRFVMPRSSSSTAVPLLVVPVFTRQCDAGWAGAAMTAPAQPGAAAYTGLFVAGLILPLMISPFSVLISACRLAGTLLAKSWYGASVTPPLASVPM